MLTTDRSPLVLQPAQFLALEGLYQRWPVTPVASPELVVVNEPLAAELGLDVEALRGPDGIAVLSGSRAPEGVTTVAQAYAGHQFGALVPRLGDGRALLLGEVIDPAGGRHDLHLKGSGPTPFARGGDGRAALGPMLREYLISEAMHALGVPTTRSLAVVATGERVARETMLPGAVLARVAASHLRVGTFQYAALLGDAALLTRLADHAIARHHPDAADAEQPYVALFEAVAEVQAALVARWMLIGFVHGVMNTDNMTISGETIDYGPCAFMDRYDTATVFSSIDHGGRYAFGNQPRIAHWNLARLGEALLPILAADFDAAVEAANAVLQSYPARFERHWTNGMRAKLGLHRCEPSDSELFAALLDLLQVQSADFTMAFRSLSRWAAGDPQPARSLFPAQDAFDGWAARWDARRAGEGRDSHEVVTEMERANPVYIPRNHRVEEALAAAGDGDLEPLHRLVAVLADPFTERPEYEAYATPAPPDAGRYRTFCGT